MRVVATLSRSGIKDLNDFIGKPFLSPEKERLGEIVKVKALPGPYCEVTIVIEPACIMNPHVKTIFFPDMYYTISAKIQDNQSRRSL